MIDIFETAKELFSLEDYDCIQVAKHEGGRNLVYICSKDGENKYILRISTLATERKQTTLRRRTLSVIRRT